MPVRTRGLLVTGSVVAALAASGGTVLTLPDRLAGDDASPTVSPTANTVPTTATAASTESIGRPVTGAQIAEAALAPARERATAIAEKLARQEQERAAAAAAQNTEQTQPPEGDDQWGGMSPRLREYVRKACAEGRMRSPICANT